MAAQLSSLDLWSDILAVRQRTPLVHSITNLVAINLNANTLLAVGASPVMAHAHEEVTAMVGIAQALVLNIGTLDPYWIRGKARQEVGEAVDAMKKRGLVVNRPTPEQLREWSELADKLYPRIRGTMVPAETFDEVFSLLKAYRTGKDK